MCKCGHSKSKHRRIRTSLIVIEDNGWYHNSYGWCNGCEDRCEFRYDTNEAYAVKHPQQRDRRLPLESTLKKRMVAHPEWYR